ncbi:MAG: NAD(P)H-dependent oxidoreductase [Erythrobacter sp.]
MAETPTQPCLLVVWHSRTGASEAMARAVSDAGKATLVHCDAVTPDTLLCAAGYVFVCPENLGGMSGAMKEMFDRTYYPVLGQIEGRPFTSIIAAGSDGSGAQRQMDRIVTGWRLRRISEPIICNFDAQTPEAILAPKTVSESDLKQCRRLGAGFAEALSQGIF